MFREREGDRVSDESGSELEAELAELRARVQALEDDRAIRSLLAGMGTRLTPGTSMDLWTFTHPTP